ncbi:hypothetical protein KIL84_011302 [Mauremys mutica]|uniref:Uncharacterized protein n=1 Tax=Mauremys mutica TaxID=74926 RepID=A0A9D4B2A6_9SAUR|nr:hypothetical protein KIL84_011302 [Mauremys mutica]
MEARLGQKWEVATLSSMKALSQSSRSPAREFLALSGRPHRAVSAFSQEERSNGLSLGGPKGCGCFPLLPEHPVIASPPLSSQLLAMEQATKLGLLTQTSPTQGSAENIAMGW